MTDQEKLAILKDRFTRLDGSPKNIKAPGVVRKVRRQVRNIEKSFK